MSRMGGGGVVGGGFFFNETATTEIYTLSLHDALPIFDCTKGTGLISVGLLSRQHVPQTVPNSARSCDRGPSTRNGSPLA